MNKIQSASLFGTLFLAAFPLCAQAPIVVETNPSRMVSYADLDVTTAAGLAALNGRIRRAANSLCTIGGEGVVILEERMDKRQCLQSAMSSVEPQLQQIAARGSNLLYAGRSVVRVSRR